MIRINFAARRELQTASRRSRSKHRVSRVSPALMLLTIVAWVGIFAAFTRS